MTTPDLRPLDVAPNSIRPPFDEPDNRRDYVAALHEAIGLDVELGAYDHRIIAWLADWDVGTVGTIVSLLYRVRAAGAGYRADETREA